MKSSTAVSNRPLMDIRGLSSIAFLNANGGEPLVLGVDLTIRPRAARRSMRSASRLPDAMR